MGRGGWNPFAAKKEEAGPPKEFLYGAKFGMPVVRERVSYSELLRDIRSAPSPPPHASPVTFPDAEYPREPIRPSPLCFAVLPQPTPFL